MSYSMDRDATQTWYSYNTWEAWVDNWWQVQGFKL